ncbi:protein-glutamine gamma-glutamyltransferase E-like [Pelodytes ibericus]
MPITSFGSSTSWSASSSSRSSTMTISVNIPAAAIIGAYRLTMEITSEGRKTSRFLGQFYVLFNPWASGDDVFMNSEAERTEYVLNETGLIFYGSANSRGSRRWDLGQFEDGILEITLALLDRSLEAKKDPLADLSKRNSAIYIGRILSAMINVNDDNGVIVGRWSGDYSGGISPTVWNGSVPILHQWRQSGPVKYGQCWVFAGVLCTVLRCLGIPTRIITNFESAHDTNRDLFIDSHYNRDGIPVSVTSDSVWNFHAWVESWFARPDIGNLYNGWQILDATPQELSEGIFCLGPTSRHAVKVGDVHLDYDTAFLYSEMNADSLTWIQNEDGSFRKIATDTKSVGQFTSTKAVGSFTREDVTNGYKYSEGSPEEREIFQKARSKLARPRFMSMAAGRASIAKSSDDPSAEPAAKPGFTGSFKQSGQSQVGEDFTVTLVLQNSAADTKNVKVSKTATAIIYTSSPVKEILKEEQCVVLGPNKEMNIQFKVTYSQYKNAITSDNMIKLVAVCEDEKGGKLLIDTVVTLKNPPLLLKVSGQPVKNELIMVEIIFSNPINEVVLNSHIIVEGSGLLKKPLKIDVPTLKPNERTVTQFDIAPYRSGPRCLMVDFSSNNFSGVKAYQEINVAED